MLKRASCIHELLKRGIAKAVFRSSLAYLEADKRVAGTRDIAHSAESARAESLDERTYPFPVFTSDSRLYRAAAAGKERVTVTRDARDGNARV